MKIIDMFIHQTYNKFYFIPSLRQQVMVAFPRYKLIYFLLEIPNYLRLCSLYGMKWGENGMKNYIEVWKRMKKVWDNGDKIWI